MTDFSQLRHEADSVSMRYEFEDAGVYTRELIVTSSVESEER